jgi:hypothetical protein
VSRPGVDTTQRTIESELVKRRRFRREPARLAGGVVLPRFADIRYSGRVASGRRATVGFAGVGARTRVRLGVAADDATSFSVVKKGFFEWLGSAFGLAAPVHVTAEGRERALLARRTVREAIDALFLSRADSLELARGELVALFPFFPTPPEAYFGLLLLLDEVARHFERTELRVRVLRGVRRALSGVHGPRCAYCHGGLSGDEDDLVACEECATVLHASCWHENARCPILGCVGVEPESGD